MNKNRGNIPPSREIKTIKEENLFDFDNPWLMVRDWYSSELGQALLANEKQSLNKLLEQIFGYNLVQLGCLDENGLTAHSRTSFQYVFESLSHVSQANSCTKLLSGFEQLPIQNQSVDAVILPHTLEFERNPHQILREVERILVAEGKAVFLGFNPFSPWGLWHKYWEIKIKRKTRRKWKKNNYLSSKTRDINKLSSQLPPLPSCGHLISQRRLRDWLQLLGFDIELVSEYFYRPPISSSVLLKKLEFMEQAGQFSKVLPAGGYLLVATKRVSTLTPIREGWKLSNNLLTPETIETAGMKSDNHSTFKYDIKTKPNHKIIPQLKDNDPHGQK